MAPNDQEDEESASEKKENGLNAIETQAAVRCGLCWWLWFCLLRNELLVVFVLLLIKANEYWSGIIAISMMIVAILVLAGFIENRIRG